MGGGGSGDMHPSIPSCQWEGGAVAGAAAVLAGLQPLQGTWSLGLSLKVFLFIHNDPKGRKRERKPLPQGGGMDHVKEQSESTSCVASPIILSSCPHKSLLIKTGYQTQIPLTLQVQMSSGNTIENILIRV